MTSLDETHPTELLPATVTPLIEPPVSLRVSRFEARTEVPAIPIPIAVAPTVAIVGVAPVVVARRLVAVTVAPVVFAGAHALAESVVVRHALGVLRGTPRSRTVERCSHMSHTHWWLRPCPPRATPLKEFEV